MHDRPRHARRERSMPVLQLIHQRCRGGRGGQTRRPVVPYTATRRVVLPLLASLLCIPKYNGLWRTRPLKEMLKLVSSPNIGRCARCVGKGFWCYRHHLLLLLIVCMRFFGRGMLFFVCGVACADLRRKRNRVGWCVCAFISRPSLTQMPTA